MVPWCHWCHRFWGVRPTCAGKPNFPDLKDAPATNAIETVVFNARLLCQRPLGARGVEPVTENKTFLYWWMSRNNMSSHWRLIPPVVGQTWCSGPCYCKPSENPIVQTYNRAKHHSAFFINWVKSFTATSYARSHYEANQ